MSARNIKVDYFYLQPGHGPWMMGGPNDPQHYIDLAKAEVAKLYGPNRPMLVLPPEAKFHELSNPKRKRIELPKYNMMAWLSSEPINPAEGDYSHLVLIWWGHEFPGPIPTIADEVWSEHAKDCYP